MFRTLGYSDFFATISTNESLVKGWAFWKQIIIVNISAENSLVRVKDGEPSIVNTSVDKSLVRVKDGPSESR